jgi:hypothetical protein
MLACMHMHTVLAMLYCRYEKSQREDGRRCHKWFLVDHLGSEHVAVVGIETDTMDGHYSYQAVSLASSSSRAIASSHLCASLQQQAHARLHCSLRGMILYRSAMALSGSACAAGTVLARCTSLCQLR